MPRRRTSSSGSSGAPGQPESTNSSPGATRTNMREVFAEVARRRASHFARGAGASTLAVTGRRANRGARAAQSDGNEEDSDQDSLFSGTEDEPQRRRRSGASRNWPGPFATGLAILRDRRRALRRRAKALRQRRSDRASGESAAQRRRVSSRGPGGQREDHSSESSDAYDSDSNAAVDPDDEASFIPIPMWSPGNSTGDSKDGAGDASSARSPKRAPALAPLAPGQSAVPSLVDLCIRFVGALFDHVEELGPLPNTLRRSIARSLALGRKLDGRSVRLLCDEPCDEVVIPDGAAVAEHQLVSLFRGQGEDAGDVIGGSLQPQLAVGPAAGAGAGSSSASSGAPAAAVRPKGPARAVEGLDSATSAADAVLVDSLPGGTALRCVSLHNCGRALTDRAARQVANSVPWQSGTLKQLHVGGAYQLTDAGMLALLRSASKQRSDPSGGIDDGMLGSSGMPNLGDIESEFELADGKGSGKASSSSSSAAAASAEFASAFMDTPAGTDAAAATAPGIDTLSLSCCSLLRGPVAAHINEMCPALRALSIDACAGLADDELAGSCDESNAGKIDLASLSAMTDVRTDSDAVAGMSKHVVRARAHENQQGKGGSGGQLPPSLRRLPRYAGVLRVAHQLRHLSLTRLAAVTDAVLVPLLSRVRRAGQLRSLVIRDVPRCGDASILALCLGISSEPSGDSDGSDYSSTEPSQQTSKSGKHKAKASTKGKKSSPSSASASASASAAMEDDDNPADGPPDLPPLPLQLLELSALPRLSGDALRAVAASNILSRVRHLNLSRLNAIPIGEEGPLVACICSCGHYGALAAPEEIPQQLPGLPPRRSDTEKPLPPHKLLLDPPAIWSPEIMVPIGAGTLAAEAVQSADEQLADVADRVARNRQAPDSQLGFRAGCGLVSARFAGLRCMTDRSMAAMALTSPLTLRSIDVSWCRQVTDAGIGYLAQCCGHRLLPSQAVGTGDSASVGGKRSRDAPNSVATAAFQFDDLATSEGLREIACWGQSHVSQKLASAFARGNGAQLEIRGMPGARVPLVE